MIKLRPFRASDVDLLVSFLNSENNSNKVTQYITGAIPNPYTIADALCWVEHANKPANVGIIKAIEFDGQFVGCISATIGQFEYAKSAELGYWIGEQYWGLGVTTEAVKQFCRHLMNTTNLNRMFVSVVIENKASVRVLEKNEFSCEGILKNASFKNGRFYDEQLMARLSEQPSLVVNSFK